MKMYDVTQIVKEIVPIKGLLNYNTEAENLVGLIVYNQNTNNELVLLITQEWR